jgi:hypothetical protein
MHLPHDEKLLGVLAAEEAFVCYVFLVELVALFVHVNALHGHLLTLPVYHKPVSAATGGDIT